MDGGPKVGHPRSATTLLTLFQQRPKRIWLKSLPPRPIPGVFATWTSDRERGVDMSIDFLALMGLALIDLFWWLRK